MTKSSTIDRDVLGPSPFLAEAANILGQGGLVTDAERIEPWLTDWRGRYVGKAFAMAQPANADELAKLMALCHREGISVVAQGGNSGMVGGATPDDSGKSLLLSMRRMDGVEIDADAMIARCGAGVVLQTLHEAADAARLRFPLSLGGKGSATVGGLVSTNAGGTQVLRFGVMRALVLGLDVVLADGRRLDLAAPLRKDNRGFDLKQMFIGSEGTLGIVTGATLQLYPAVAERRVVMAGVPSMAGARRLLLHCQAAMGDALEGFEVMPRETIEAVVDYLPDARDPLEGMPAWYALLEFTADARSVEALGLRVENLLAEAFDDGLCEDAVIAANETQAEAFWQLRESIAMAERARGPALQHDISVPVDRMPDFVDAATARIEEDYPGHGVIAFGHLGDGNVHFHVTAPAGVDGTKWQREPGKAISTLIYDLVTQWGGSISAEHGIGQDKLKTLQRTHDTAALDVMRAVKDALDPDGLLNPGKLI